MKKMIGALVLVGLIVFTFKLVGTGRQSGAYNQKPTGTLKVPKGVVAKQFEGGSVSQKWILVTSKIVPVNK